ncbi:MAG: EamA family transporter [Thermoplasmata archaeon]|nr:EamA family transporter [Thermoplasmata archaeon]
MVYMAAAVILWSTIETVSRGFNGSLAPVVLAFWRFFLGSVVLFVYAAGDLNITRRSLVFSALGGFLGVTLTFTLFHISLLYIRAGIAASIISTVPLFVLPMSWLGGERPRRWSILGVVVGLAGIILLSLEDARGGNMTGILLALGAVLVFSVFTMINRRTGRETNPATATFLSLSMGTIFFMPVILAAGDPLFPRLDMWGVLSLVYLGVAATGLGYLLYFRGFDMVQAHRGSTVFYMKPLAASIFAFFLLGETLGVLSILGIFVIIFSLYMALRL